MYEGIAEEQFTKRFEPTLWRNLGRYVMRYPRTVAGLCTFAVITAALETSLPLVTRAVIDTVASQGIQANLLGYGLIYLVIMCALALSIGSFIYLGGRIRTYVAHDIRQAGFDNLQQLSFNYFDHRPVGWLVARMTSDCERLSNILAWGVLDFVWGITLMLGMAIAMLIMQPMLALVTLLVVPILCWVSIQFQQRILTSAREVRKTNSRITGSFNEAIMGVRTSKVFVREQANLEDFSQLTGGMYKASIRNALQSALYLPIVLTLGSLAAGLALSFGGFQVLAGGITIGTLIAFMTYARQFFEPIEELAAWFAELQMAQASAERVLALVAAEPEISDSASVVSALTKRHPAGLAADGYPERIKTMTFSDVSFAYASGETALSHINFTVHAGETIALVGATGGGKSTLVNLACRFYEPTAGRILIDGVDYRERSLAWLQSQLGTVQQNPHIFSGTVAENIRYGNPQASDEQVQAAAQLAGAHEFISTLPRGYNSYAGEGGNRLSTGRKQLVAIARAILTPAQIVILDEATSSVDTETEERIQAGLAQVLEGRIAFVIAHRLNTVRAADRIFYVEHGRIVEQGNHRELLAQQGRYYELYAGQRLQPADQRR